MSRTGRRLAFDYGDVRIGVAVCDADAILSTPLEPLDSKNPALLIMIKELVDEFEPVRIYVGDPLNLSGEPSESSAKARLFAEKLKVIASCEVLMIDERLTTVSATALLTQAGISAKNQRRKIDSLSAVAILESGLARDRR
jgi:putative holliday junction resolvase